MLHLPWQGGVNPGVSGCPELGPHGQRCVDVKEAVGRAPEVCRQVCCSCSFLFPVSVLMSWSGVVSVNVVRGSVMRCYGNLFLRGVSKVL